MSRPVARTAPAVGVDARLYLRESELDQGASLIKNAARALRQNAIRHASGANLLEAELDTLIELFEAEGCDVTELRERMDAPKQSLTRNLNALEQKNFIERRLCKQDGRKRRLYLTSNGRELATAMAEGWREILLSAFRACGPETVSNARRLLLEVGGEQSSTEGNDTDT